MFWNVFFIQPHVGSKSSLFWDVTQRRSVVTDVSGQRIISIRQQYRALYMSHDFYIVDSSTKYFVARQQCERNPLLRFHGNRALFCIFDSSIYVNNNTKGVYCCVSTAKLVPRTLRNLTLYAYRLCCWLWRRWRHIYFNTCEDDFVRGTDFFIWPPV